MMSAEIGKRGYVCTLLGQRLRGSSLEPLSWGSPAGVEGATGATHFRGEKERNRGRTTYLEAVQSITRTISEE